MEHNSDSARAEIHSRELTLLIILFWPSDPVHTDEGDLEDEVGEFRRLLGGTAGVFELHSQWAVSIGDMADGLARYQPDIVHFSGSGNTSGKVWTRRPGGTSGALAPAELEGLLSEAALSATDPTGVVFNTCYSDGLGLTLAESVDFVVGTQRQVGHRASTLFTANFYDALGEGQTAEEAFDHARNELPVSLRDQPTIHSFGDPTGWFPDHASLEGAVAPGAEAADAVRGLGPSRSPTVPASEDEADAPREEEPWNLETTFPREVVVGSTTTLTVELTRERSSDREVSTLPVRLASGTEVSVVVQAKQGFQIEGTAEATLQASDEALPVGFRLRATDPGQGLVRVLFFVEATALGAITLEPAILDADASADHARIPSSQVLSALSVGSGRPDLELLVLEESTPSGRPTYSIRVTATDEALGIHLREFGPIELHTDARRYFAELFTDIETLDLTTAEDRARAQKRLEAKGSLLFSTLLPPPLQQLLWDVRHRITRIRIDSEDPYIPWELIRLSGPAGDGTIIEDRFLCEYEVTRWIPGLALNSRLTLEDFGVVIPADSDLESAQEEKEFLNGLATTMRRITEVTPSYEELMDAFAVGAHDVWHFSGHGSVKDTQDPNRAAIELSDGHQLNAEDLSGAQANLGRAKPLVFLNACQIGRGAMSLTGLGGWARQFLYAGASSFVGAMWNVHDNPAKDFARAFYTRLLDGAAIGTATREAREHIRQYQDATWLAYTVYGHPSAAIGTER